MSDDKDTLELRAAARHEQPLGTDKDKGNPEHKTRLESVQQKMRDDGNVLAANHIQNEINRLHGGEALNQGENPYEKKK